MRLLPTISLLLLLGFVPVSTYSQPSYSWQTQGEKVIGLELDWDEEGETQLFKKGSKVNILHKSRFSAGKLSVSPVIAFQAGQEYSLWIDDQAVLTFRIPERENFPPKVVAIYPKQQILPANLLRMVIEFNCKMSESLPYPYIFLRDENGDTLERAILLLEPALWDIDHKRLTLWLDPGRIKRELNLNQRYGNPLEPGKKYELLLDPQFSSSRGTKMKTALAKSFYVGEADRRKPEVKIIQPHIESQEPLQIIFSEEVDKFTVEEGIFLYKDGNLIADAFVHGSDTKIWQWKPSNIWTKGEYEVKVSTSIEDFAGNNLNRLFDVDLQKENKPEGHTYLDFSFELK